MTIGLTFTGDETKHENYVRWLKGTSCKDQITIIPLDANNNNLYHFDYCNALVLSGGIDINPARYGGQPEYNNKPLSWNDDRDTFETRLYISARQRNLPVLGICRGMQLINVLEGGTLYQDLEELNSIHRFEVKDKVHSININRNSLMYEVTNLISAEVSSAHHQAISTIANSLSANCYAQDGTIEGLEWKEKNDKPFLICVQWHPERMFDNFDSPASKNIREAFLEAVTKSIQKNESH